LSHYPTISDVLKSPCGSRNQHLAEDKPKKKILKARNDCKEVQWIHWQLKYWCIEKGIRLEKEFKFAKGRRYRADFALPEFKIAIEYDGLNSEKSGHTTLLGFTKDTDKINLAISLGWKVLRFTCINYKQVLQEVEKNIKCEN